VFAGEPIAKHPKKEMAHFNDHDFLSAKPELRSKHAFDAWQDPSVFKRHPSKKAHTLSKQIIVNDARISQRAVLDTVEANEEHFTPASCLQPGRPIAYSLNKKNRWNLSTQDLIKNKNSNNDVTFSCAKELVRWDGEGFTNPRANAYANCRNRWNYHTATSAISTKCCPVTISRPTSATAKKAGKVPSKGCEIDGGN